MTICWAEPLLKFYVQAFALSTEFIMKMLQCISTRRSQDDEQPMEAGRTEYSGQPVSPKSQSLRSSILSDMCIHAVLELEQPMIITQLYSFADASLTRNPLFSCIMQEDDGGVLRWQKKTVKLDDHIIIINDFDPAVVDTYIYELSRKPVDLSRPLWEFHVLNHKTSNTGASMVMRFHHSLGDGVSLMSWFFSVVTRVDNPHLPPTFPTSATANANPQPSIKYSTTSTSSERWSSFMAKFYQMRPWYTILVVFYVVVDGISSLLRSWGWIDDSKLRPIPGALCDQLIPAELSSVTLQLEEIKQIKKCVGGTVNDVLTGIILYATQRYLQIHLLAVGKQISLEDAYEKRFELPQEAAITKQLKNLRFTALCAMNTRLSPGVVQNLDDMLKPKSKAAWGNNVFYLPIGIPFSIGKVENPLEFVKRAKRTLDRQKLTSSFIGRRFVRLLARFKRPQELSRYLRNTMASATVGISNMVGPMEKVAIEGNPIKTISFFVSSGRELPLSLFYIMSYMGTVVMRVNVQNTYMDPTMLSKCLREAFNEMKEASIVHRLAG